MTAVQLSGLTKSYGGGGASGATTAVNQLDLSIADGEFLTLLGPSGCGKTTTLRCVGGLEMPDAGDIRFDDEVIVSAADGTFVPPEKRQIGMVFQSYAVWPHMTVQGNVMYPLRVRRVATKEAQRRVREVLELVGLGDYAERMATQLSGGQQQRVALARALVSEPRLLLFDEPLSNLDAKLRVSMRTELLQMHERIGTTSLYVTHDQAEALALSDRVVVMRDGQVQQIGVPAEIYWRPRNRFVADFIGFDNVLAADVAERRADALLLRARPAGPALWCPATTGIDGAQNVGFAFRSSGISMSDQPMWQDDTNMVDGVVLGSTYLGEHFEYRVDVDGVTLQVRSPGVRSPEGGTPSPLQPGERVRLRIPPENIVVVADDEGGPERNGVVPAASVPEPHDEGGLIGQASRH